MPMLARLEETVTVEPQGYALDARHRPSEAFPSTPTVTFRALVGSATPQQAVVYSQPEHPATHALTQRGAPYSGAKPGDLLSVGGRHYYVTGIEDPGLQHTYTVYFAQERFDI